MKICDLRLNFVECQFFLESNSPDILTLHKEILDSTVSSTFSVTGYLPLIRKDSATHMHVFVFYLKNFLLYESYLWKTLQILTYISDYLWLPLLQSLSYSFFLYQSRPSSLYTVFDLVSSNKDQALSINSSANVLVFGDFNVH